MNSQVTNAAFAAYRNARFFGSLNGLRCFSIALVLWHHSGLVRFSPEEARILLRGFTGVDFFFVLSGFLITTLLLREEERKGAISLRAFYWRRALRILPVYFLLVFSVSFWWIGVRGQDQWWPHLPYYLVFVANFVTDDIPLLGQTWSLSVEEQYYLIWPAVLVLLPALTRFRASFLVVIICGAVLMSADVLPRLELFEETDIARYVLPTNAYAAILIGSLTGVVLHHRRGFQLVWRLVGYAHAPVVLFAMLVAAWQFLPLYLLGWPALVMHVLMALILASLVVREDNQFAPFLQARSVARMGEISYGLYLWHLVGLHLGAESASLLGFTGDAVPWVGLPVYLISSVVISEISFRYFESYFLRLKDRGAAVKHS